MPPCSSLPPLLESNGVWRLISSGREVSVKKWIVVAVASVALTGCNEGEQTVESGISEDGMTVECPSADVRTTYEDTEPRCEIYSCRWNCVKYEGIPNQYVDRQYKSCAGSRWVFEAEYTRDSAACNIDD